MDEKLLNQIKLHISKEIWYSMLHYITNVVLTKIVVYNILNATNQL